MKRSISEPLCSIASRCDDSKLNINGLKTRFPIKINGFYIGSSENLTKTVPNNVAIDNILQRRRSLRENTPIKIEGNVFSRSADNQNNDFESIKMPFGEYRKNIKPNNRRFCTKNTEDLENKTTFVTHEAANKNCNKLENVINQMKTTLNCIGRGVGYKTLKNINRKADQWCIEY